MDSVERGLGWRRLAVCRKGNHHFVSVNLHDIACQSPEQKLINISVRTVLALKDLKQFSNIFCLSWDLRYFISLCSVGINPCCLQAHNTHFMQGSTISSM